MCEFAQTDCLGSVGSRKESAIVAHFGHEPQGQFLIQGVPFEVHFHRDCCAEFVESEIAHCESLQIDPKQRAEVGDSEHVQQGRNSESDNQSVGKCFSLH